VIDRRGTPVMKADRSKRMGGRSFRRTAPSSRAYDRLADLVEVVLDGEIGLYALQQMRLFCRRWGQLSLGSTSTAALTRIGRCPRGPVNGPCLQRVQLVPHHTSPLRETRRRVCIVAPDTPGWTAYYLEAGRPVAAHRDTRSAIRAGFGARGERNGRLAVGVCE